LTTPFDKIVTIDFETRWDKKDYTLSKMTTEEYIRDKRFKAFGACVHEFGTDSPIEWVGGDGLREYFSGVDWGRTAVLAHNAQFDVSIMEWVYAAKPAFIFDTLSMARALRGVEVGNSLAKLAQDFGLPPKGTAVHSTDGLLELDATIERELAEYCAHDVYLCEEIFKRLGAGYPKSELRLIDMTLKMYTRPQLELDSKMLIKALTEEGELREGLLQKLGIQEVELASNFKFAYILQSLGVVAPTKVSKTTGKEAYALAKNDALFQALLNGEREDVALLCEARLKVKSTTERTRAQRFLDISQRGKLPVPLSYYGALSGRWTAAKGSAINMQNLKRGSFLRKAIMAPEGYQLVVGDLSQIEPRVLAWLADYKTCSTSSGQAVTLTPRSVRRCLTYPDSLRTAIQTLRQSAKSALLGCGYGLGWASFASQLLTGFLGAPPVRYDKAFAKTLGVDQTYAQRFIDWDDNVAKMLEIPHTCTQQELLTHCLASKKIIDIYRATAHPVATFWDMCSQLIEDSLYGGKVYQHKCLTFSKERIELPNGMSLLYPELRRTKDEKGRSQWVYGPNATKLYAGKVTNNVTQAVARIVMTDGMLRVTKKYPVVGTVHDEQIVLVPDDEVAEAKPWVLGQMTVEPKYMPGIPLAADGGAHRRYGEAKQ
jgi:hypothetical protein